MRASSLTCRCRFCGYVIGYSTADIGADARCPQCGEMIRLPGKLAALGGIVRKRRTDVLGIALEAAGFAAMFFYFPWGLMAGAVSVYAGWRRTSVLACSSCGGILPRRGMDQCPFCAVRFGSD